jgi:hypothetical protein
MKLKTIDNEQQALAAMDAAHRDSGSRNFLDIPSILVNLRQADGV